MVRNPILRKAAVLAWLAGALLGFGGAAHAQSVQPVILDLQPAGRQATQTLTVSNTRTTAIPVELRVERLVFDANGTRGTGQDPGDLVVFPAQAVIQPGQSQVFRVQYVGDGALDKSRHYYVTVAQLPVQLPEGTTGIQVLYNIQVVASVQPRSGKPDLRVTETNIGRNTEGRAVPVVTIANQSATHGYLSRGRLTIVQRDASGRELIRQTLTGPDIQQGACYGLIGGNEVRSFTLPLLLPAETGSIDARFEPEARR